MQVSLTAELDATGKPATWTHEVWSGTHIQRPGAWGGPNLLGARALPDPPARLLGDPAPPADDGFGMPGDGAFNTPPLVEAADTGPFFHNNSVATLEAAVGFYDGDSFNNSPAGQLILQATGSPLEIDATEIQAIAAFLRVINALENIRQAEAYLTEAGAAHNPHRREIVNLAREETSDAIAVLVGASLHGDAVADLREAQHKVASRRPRIEQALAALQRARGRLLAPAQPAPN